MAYTFWWNTNAGSILDTVSYRPASIQLDASFKSPVGKIEFVLASGSSLPTGFSMTSTGLITGTPTSIEQITKTTFTVTLIAKTFNDIFLDSEDRTFSITVDSWSDTPFENWRSTYDLGFVNAGVPMNPVDFLVSPGVGNVIYYTNTPTGVRRIQGNLVLTETTDASSRKIVRLSGTPTASTENGVINFRIGATKPVANGNVSFFKNTTLTVLSKTQPQWVTPAGAVGNTYAEGVSTSITLTAVPQVSGDRVTYSLLNGSLPAGLSLVSSNNVVTITGSPSRVAVDTTNTFTIRATEKDYTGETALGISDRTFSLTVTGPTPPSFVTPSGILGDMSTLYFAMIPAPLINKITVDASTKYVTIDVSPYNLKNYGLVNNTPISISGLTGTEVDVLNDRVFYVGDADSANSNFVLYQKYGANGTPTSQAKITSSSWAYTGGGTVARTSQDSKYFETRVTANANDPGTTVVYSLDSGTLPDGLELSSTGVISGYPTSKRTTTDDVGATVYWGAVDVNGEPVTKVSQFALKATTVSGNTTRSYTIAITNQEAVWESRKNVGEVTGNFPGRVPVILNNQPLTQIISNTDPYYPYYFDGSSLGRFTQDNQFIFKMIGKNFNATEVQDSDFGLSYTITGLKSGNVANSTVAFTNIISPNTSNVAVDGWINGTLGNLGTDIKTYKFNVQVSAPNLVTYVSTNANISNYESAILVDSTYGLHADQKVTFTGNTVGNISNSATYTIKTVSSTISTPARLKNGNANISVDTVYGLEAGDSVTFSGYTQGNITNYDQYTIASISPGTAGIATFGANTSNILVDTVTGIEIGKPISFGNNIDSNITNTKTYFVSSINSNLSTTGTTNNSNSNIVVNSVLGLNANDGITVTGIAPAVYQTTVSGTANTNQVIIASNTGVRSGQTLTFFSTPLVYSTTANIASNVLTVADITNIANGQFVTFTGNSVGNINNTANFYKVSNVNANIVDLVYASNSANANANLTDASNLSVTFSTTTKFGNIDTNANVYKVSTISTSTITSNVIVGGANVPTTRTINLANLVYANNANAVLTANANGSMSVKFYEPTPSTLTTTNYQIYSVNTTSKTIRLTTTDGNASNIISANSNSLIGFRTTGKNNITITANSGSPATIKSTAASDASFTVRNPVITLVSPTPNATGQMNLVYSANNITLKEVTRANASDIMTLVSTNSPRLVAPSQEFSFIVQGSVSSGVGWSGTGNLGTINNGEISTLSVSAVFGSDTLSTTATLTANVANIKLASAKNLTDAQPVTFTGNTVGNISNLAQYYIKGIPDLSNNYIQISKSISGNTITPNVGGIMTLQSSLDDSRFKLVDGSLPPGLKLLSSGDIIGRPAFQGTSTVQTANTDTTYTFTVQGYSKTYPEIKNEKTYTLTTVQKYTDPYDNLYVRALMPADQRSKVDNLLTHISGKFNNSVTKDIYRAKDPNFGVASAIKYGHMYGVSSKYTALFEEAYTVAIAKNHYFKQLVLGDIKTAIARDKTGTIIYEVVYSPIMDSLTNSSGTSVNKTVAFPRSIVTERGDNGVPLVDYGTLVYPNSLIQMREQIKASISITDDSSLLPLWMSTQQADGNVLGYIPCWAICYTKPGKSAAVVASIKTYLTDNGFQLNQFNFGMDRFEVDRSMTSTYGGSGGTEWPTITANITSGNSTISISSNIGLEINKPVQFTLPFVKLESGTITGNTSSNVITGNGTSFDSSLVGKSIYTSSYQLIGMVQTVANATSANLTTNSQLVASNYTFYSNIAVNINDGTPYYISDLSSNTMKIRTSLYNSTLLTPNATGTLNLVTVPLSATVTDNSQDSSVVFTQKNILK